LATPRRRISDYRADNANSGSFGKKSSVICLGSDSRALGLSAAVDPRDRDHSGHAYSTSQQDEVEILSDLLAGPAGTAAPAVSEMLIKGYGSLVNILATVEKNELTVAELSVPVRRRLEYFGWAFSSAWRQQILTAPIFSNSNVLIKYLQFEMAALKRETFRVLFLDSGNRLMRDQIMWEGSVDRVQIHPREIVRVALEIQASALILAHNHPSGRAEPSKDDMRLTGQIIAACKLLDISVHDHLIIAHQDVFSMRRERSLVFST
jgi:DNA repair protein RadC